MKRIISLLTAAVLIISVFSGCGSKKNAQNSNVSNNAPAVSSNSNTASNTVSQNTGTNPAPANTTNIAKNTVSSAVNPENTDAQIKASNVNLISSNTKKTEVKVVMPYKKPVTLNNAITGAAAYLKIKAKAAGYKISDWDAAALSFYGYNLNSPVFKLNG